MNASERSRSPTKVGGIMRNSRSRLLSGMLLGVALLVGLSPVHGQDDKGADKAKKAVVLFGAKVAANDLEGVLKVVDVPFLHNINDPNKIEASRDRETLKKNMQQLLDAFKGKKVQLEVAEVIRYSKFLAAEGTQLPKEDRKL